MEYYGGRYCVSVHDIVGNGLISADLCRQWAVRGKIEVARVLNDIFRSVHDNMCSHWNDRIIRINRDGVICLRHFSKH